MRGQPIEQVVTRFCNKHFNGTWLETVCDDLIDAYGDDIIKLLAAGAVADDVCHAIQYVGVPVLRLYCSGESAVH